MRMTQSTTSYSRGDVVFVPFMFTDKPITKNRPALIISSSDYHASRREVIIAAITSQIRDPRLAGDHRIGDWRACGLVKPSAVTSILWTVKASLVGRRLGTMPQPDLKAFSGRLAEALGL